MTPQLMEAGVRVRQAMEAKKSSNAGESGGRQTSYSRVVQAGELDVAHGAILYLDDITVSFDGFKALNALSLNISAGELRCIIGPNGAGKTTMVKVLLGETPPDSGSVKLGSNLEIAYVDQARADLSGTQTLWDILAP
ncbi:MAG: ATP-binding cassette domain-containing protein, partial [Cytophagales bacterium]|nr:ATP-binding cassette domain-containing protein [Rhizobacter sp.]